MSLHDKPGRSVMQFTTCQLKRLGKLNFIGNNSLVRGDFKGCSGCYMRLYLGQLSLSRHTTGPAHITDCLNLLASLQSIYNLQKRPFSHAVYQ